MTVLRSVNIIIASFLVSGGAMAQKVKTKIHNKAMLHSYTKYSCSYKGCEFVGEHTVEEPAPLPSGHHRYHVKQSGEAGQQPPPATVTIPLGSPGM